MAVATKSLKRKAPDAAAAVEPSVRDVPASLRKQLIAAAQTSLQELLHTRVGAPSRAASQSPKAKLK